MSAVTTTVDISPILAIYCGPTAVITGPVAGVWTVDAPGVDQDALASAVADAARDTTAGSNTAALQAKARAALVVNATYLGRANPTAAQTTAQVQALTRQMNALIKLAVGDLADTSGT